MNEDNSSRGAPRKYQRSSSSRLFEYLGSGSKSKERKKSSERERSLRKSSSEGLLRIFRRSSLPKDDHTNEEIVSEAKEFSRLTTAEEDNFNKAFRTGSGPLILVPQPKNEKERLKKITNKGIQQISQQQAKQIFKDHQKLKEELFKETPPNINKEIKPKSSLTKALPESSKSLKENKEKSVSNVTSKPVDIKDELKHNQLSREIQSKLEEGHVSKSSIQNKRTEISINKLPIQNKQTEASVNKPPIQIKLTDTLANKPPIAPLVNKIQKDKTSKPISFLDNAALGIKKIPNQNQKPKLESPSIDRKGTVNIPKNKLSGPSNKKEVISNEEVGNPNSVGSINISQHPNLHSKSSSLDSADFKSKNIEEISFNIRKYSNPSELSQKQKILRENQEKTILNLHRKHLEEISKLRQGDASTDGQNKSSTVEEKINSDYMIRTSFITRSKTFDNYNLSKYASGNEGINVETNVKDTSTTIVTPTADDDKSQTKPPSDNSSKTIIKPLSVSVEPFSFSNYLTRTRKDSVGDKEKSPTSLSKLSEEIPLKAEIPKKVHFPDEVKILNESKDLNVELISSRLSQKTNSSENGDAEKSNGKEVGKPPLPKTNTVSILKRSPNSKDNVSDNINSKSFFINETRNNSFQKDNDFHGEKELNEIPVKPPRGEKSLKRQRSSSLTDSKSLDMSAQKPYEEKVFQKTIIPKDNEEVNSRPLIKEDQLFSKGSSENKEKLQDIKQENEGSQIKQIQQNMNDQQNSVGDQSQKKISSNQQQILQEQEPPHQKIEQESHHPMYQKQQVNQNQHQEQAAHETNKSVEVIKKQIQENSRVSSVHSYYGSLDRKQSKYDKRHHTSVFEENQTTNPPKPPTRVNKNKGAVGVRSASPHSKQEGVLVCACRVAEEDQILRLLKDLSKTQKFDYEFINQTDQTGRTGLCYACNNGYSKVVEFFTSQPEIELNHQDNEGNTPLHYAAQGGHVEIVSHLVNTCSRQVDLDVRNNLGFTPLMKAALQGRTKIAKILLFAGSSPHLRDYGRGYCAVEWAKFTGRNNCSELIESVQRTCSSHIKDRWASDPDFKIPNSGSSSSLSYINHSNSQDGKNSWLRHKIRKAFHKSESKKEFSVASNLTTLATCVSSPLLPCHPIPTTTENIVPVVHVVEVTAPNCYKEPEDPKSAQTQNSSKKSSRGSPKDPGEKYSNGGTSKSNGAKHSESIPSIIISS